MHMNTEFRPLRFIGESVEVEFDHPPALEKKPGCPNRFVWQGEAYDIVELLAEWHDYSRHGTMSHNMRDTHLATAARRGSWGVGRDYFRVRTRSDRIFDLYYDRAPRQVGQGKGAWFLYKELQAPSID
jgi:uncharacterized protein DUF6504